MGHWQAGATGTMRLAGARGDDSDWGVPCRAGEGMWWVPFEACAGEGWQGRHTTSRGTVSEPAVRAHVARGGVHRCDENSVFGPRV